MSTRLADAAQAYLSAGLTPVPVRPREKSPTLIPWGRFQSERPTRDEVLDWWNKSPDANIALVTGNGLLVIDLDGPDAESLLGEAGIDLPFDAPRVRTGRSDSGEHIWLRIPKDLQIRPKVALLSRGKSAVDLRADGGYALVPPSIHPSGQPYEWSSSWGGDLDSIPEAPIELIELITSKFSGDVKQVVRMADDELAELARGASEGSRNDACARLAGKLFSMGHTPEQVAFNLEYLWAPHCVPPMLPSEVRTTVYSIARKRERETAKQSPGTEGRRSLCAPDIDEMLALLGGERKRIVPTPWTLLNNIIGGGLRAGEYVLLGARPGTGKTAFALQCAWHAAQVTPVLFVTLEMSRAALNKRMYSQMTGIAQENFETGSKSELAVGALERIAPEVHRMLLRHSEDAFTVGAVNDRCEEMRDKGMSPGLIVIDYLQLLKTNDPNRDRRQQVESISRDLVRLAKQWNCPVIVLSALSRPPMNYSAQKDNDAVPHEPAPTLGSLRESGQLEHDADMVILLHRLASNDGATSVTVAKHRDGGVGRTTLRFDGPTTSFSVENAAPIRLEQVLETHVPHYTERDDVDGF